MKEFSFDFNFIKSGAPIVTLNSLGIAFNPLSRSMLGYPPFIDIGFDSVNCAIGIKGIETPNDNSFRFESKEKNGWVRVSAKDFVNYLAVLSGIDFISKAKQFIATYDDEKKMLIVVVDKAYLKDKARVLKDIDAKSDGIANTIALATGEST